MKRIVKNQGIWRAFLGSVCIVLIGLFSGCNAPSQVTAGNSSIEVAPQLATAPTGDPGHQVCDPFGTGGTAGPDHGIFGHLWYLTPDMPQYTHVADYQTYGLSAPVDLYFSQLNVPTRKFDEGFTTQDGTLLQTPQGTTLYEWFSLHFETTIKLSRLDTAGEYQFAVLSDDGSVMSINDTGTGYRTLINNDGVTPSRLGCAAESITFDNSTSLPIKVDYFQGPRYHIALILLWREIPSCSGPTTDPTVLSETQCGKAGNGMYFDYTQVPQPPTQVWLDMLSRGWKVLSPENYYLPDYVTTNPCTGGGPGGGGLGV